MSNQPSDVNPAQWNAITFKGSHLLIVAGPGTGKTHTLTHRIAHIVQGLPEPDGERVLAITFTNRAAQEMRERLLTRLPKSDFCLTVGTFHQFCLSVLRQYTKEANLPDGFRVADAEEMKSLAKDLAPRERDWLDFDELLSETLKLFENRPDILGKTQNIYRTVFVDEYQDINAVQHALLKILVGEKGRITAFGDPNQAIYGFRGSDVGYFNSFSKDFPGAVTLSLSENYRCAQNLLSASGQMIAGSDCAPVPELTAKIYSQGRLTVHEAATDRAEAEYVVHQIEKMVGGTSMFSQDSGRVENYDGGEHSFGDIAVLYRLNSQCLALRQAFDRSGIPYQISSKKMVGKSQNLSEDFYFQGSDNDMDIVVEKVSLMTIHAAKGLEFSAVFMIGCEQNLLPLHLENLVSDVEEERRLFYVGMTRAKERLFLVRARLRRLYGKTYHNAPSVFLSDIEEGLKEYEKAHPKLKRHKKDEEQLSLF